MPAVSAAILMNNEGVDPKQTIWDEVNEFLPQIEVMGAQVLFGVYVRPERTAGGLLLPQTSRDEDNYQGKVGLILKMGPLAFTEDDHHKWAGRIPVVGDWVLVRVGDAFPWILGKRNCKFVEDVAVKAIVGRPDMVM